MLLEVSKLNCVYRQNGQCKAKLENIDFSLKEGTITGIIGRNGAGKTTLLNCIAGIKGIESGSVFIDGISMIDQPKRAKQKVGFVGQEGLFTEAYYLEDIAGHFGSYYETFTKEKFLSLCERFQLNVKQRFRELSAGMRVKFTFAFALACQPKLLLMDEPLEGLDPVFRREFTDLLYDAVANEDCSILYSTHLMDELEKTADYLLVLDKGKQLLFSDVISIGEQYFDKKQFSLKELLFRLTGEKLYGLEAVDESVHDWEADSNEEN